MDPRTAPEFPFGCFNALRFLLFLFRFLLKFSRRCDGGSGGRPPQRGEKCSEASQAVLRFLQRAVVLQQGAESHFLLDRMSEQQKCFLGCLSLSHTAGRFLLCVR